MKNDIQKPDGGQPKSSLPSIALGLDVAAVVCFLVGLLCFYSAVLLIIGLILFLATAILPFAAIITGICALCLGKNRIGTGGIICSIIAIVVPLLTVLITVMLFSSGVAVIRWM